MNRTITMLPVMLLCLLGAALGLGSTTVPEETQTVPTTKYEEPVYQLDTMTAQNIFAAGNGTELAHYSYQLLTLYVPNWEKLSPTDAELAQRNIDNFNNRMIALMDESVEVGMTMGNDALAFYQQKGNDLYYYDETEASGRLLGNLISVQVDHSSYAGGAHANTHIYSYLFDLLIGQFIDPLQIAENPEDFRVRTADLLVEKAEALEKQRGQWQYWSDYAEILSQWNEGAVLFDDDGMRVVYSPYGLGPYTIGTVELRLTFEELAELAGNSALERLGVTIEQERSGTP